MNNERIAFDTDIAYIITSDPDKPLGLTTFATIIHHVNHLYDTTTDILRCYLPTVNYLKKQFEATVSVSLTATSIVFQM